MWLSFVSGSVDVLRLRPLGPMKDLKKLMNFVRELKRNHYTKLV